MDKLCPHADPDQKISDYHHCLRIILSELAAHQKLGGLDWKLCLDGKTDVPCRFQIPVNCIVGDAEGHDKLCARKSNRTARTKGSLCRHCNCPFEELGNPHFNGKLTKCGQTRRWRNRLDEKSKQKLAELGYKHMHDGFVDIQFSDPVRGLHGCTPAEVLHAFQMGLAERSIEICFEQRKLLKQKRKGSVQTHQATKKAKVVA